MDDDHLHEIYDGASETGLRNLALLELAAAWCQNIDVTKGPLGTGMVEQMTGLPISGGSLRCDHAKAPTSFGVALEHNAVNFYEQNCIGCPQRKPTDAKEHLGTWADVLIAEREEQRRQQEEALRKAAEARQRRREERRLLLGAPNTTLQSILDLIDRIDAENRDPEAERLLLSHAEMSPGDFPDELIDHMTKESIAIGNEALLQAVIAVFDRQGRPAKDRMLNVAFEAVGCGVAAAAAGRVIAVHAGRFDVDDRSLGEILLLAAGREDHFGRSHRADAEPAPLIRLYDIDPERAIRVTGAKLGDPEISWRAIAAHAADKLVGARPSAGLRLLPALLDAVKFPDKSFYLGDSFASAQARKVVGDIFVSDPSSAAREIDVRMQTADPHYVRQLWGCFDNVPRGRLGEPIARDVAQAIATRAIALLQQDLDPEFLREVSDTLELVSTYHGDSLELCLPEVIALVLFWADRSEAEGSKPISEAAVPFAQEMLTSIYFSSTLKPHFLAPAVR